MATPTATTRALRPALTIAAAVLPFALGAIVAFVAYRWLTRPDVTIGVEGRRTVEIVGLRLVAAPFTPGDALAVRIASIEPTARGYRYDLRYMAFGPGRHDIAKSLRRPDGTPPEPQAEFAVRVAALVPEDYSGELYATPSSEINLHSRYTLVMGLTWGLWAVLLVPLIWYGRKWRRSGPPPPPPLNIAEQLARLLKLAAVEKLTPEQQADLEQLLLAFWSRRLNLADEPLVDTIEQLRRHPQAGAQWNRVERWLHRRSAPADGVVAQELLHDLSRLK